MEFVGLILSILAWWPAGLLCIFSLLMVFWLFKNLQEESRRQIQIDKQQALDNWTLNYGTPEEKIEVLQRQLEEKDKEARRKSALAAWLWWNR